MSTVTVNDLNNAQLDVNTIAAVATSSAPTVTDRLGNTKNTLSGINAAVLSSAAAVQGSIGYLPPVAYAAGINLTLAAQTVGYSGQTYAPILSALPFTTSGTFEAAKFRLIQGISGVDLAASGGAALVGFRSNNLLKRLDESPSIIDIGASTTNSASLNSNVITLAEALTQSTLTVPNGVFALPDATFLAKEYTGPGRWSFGGVEVPMTRKSLLAQVVQQNAMVLGDMAQFYAAIISNNATVVLCGDSISEGVSQTTYEDSYFSMLSEDFRRKCPGVAWNIQNLSLSGMGMGAAQSPGFVGGASDDYATIFNRPKGTAPNYPSSNANIGVITGNADLWPNGSTTGKAWRDHLRDASPDLLIISHGQNDVDGNSASFAANCKSLVSYARTWAKVPSIAIVTACPATRKQAAWRTNGANIQVSADAARGVALETGCTLIDANRQYIMLRDGVDIVNLARRPVAIGSYPTSWNGMAPMPAISGNNLTWSGAGKIYNTSTDHQARDLHYTAQFTASGTGQAFGLVYRYPGTNGYEVQVSGSFIRLYWGAAVVAAVGITALTGGTTHQLDVICIGARHQACLDGIKVIDIYDYNSLLSGGVGVEMNGAGTVGYLSLLQGISRIIGPSILTEDELLGVSPSDYSTNTATKGGDGIHHPSFMIGHYSTYYAACLGMVDAAVRVSSRPSVSQATSKPITPNAANNALGASAPNLPTSYPSADGYIQLSGSLTPNGATTIAAGVTAATLNIAHVPNREVDGSVYIAGTLTYCRVLANGNIIFGANVTTGQLANIDNFRFRQNN